MKKWITDIIQPTTRDATRQAKADIAQIAKKMGYQISNIFRYNDAGESDQALSSRIDGITAAIAPGDLLVYQYPSLNSARFETRFIELMHVRNVKVICLIHDVLTLRNQPDTAVFLDEIAYFNSCDVLIVHNQRMAAKLQELGVTTKMVYQQLLDYLDDNHDDSRYTISPANFQRGAVIAGNILKSDYLSQWHYQTPITVFGVSDAATTEELQANPQVNYLGSRPRWDLIQELPQTFGLAWDSNTPEFRYRDYTQYNHPHKVSMYLAHGLPVIVWRQAAVAELIVQNHLGIAIDNLDQLDHVLAALSDQQIATMLTNVSHFGQLLRDGWFTRQGLQAAEQALIFPAFKLN
ncbi:sugar transferase [Lapidilactobacillus wuchangensis]|uniref:sugar transferase n=1 Tax=Lapidilactobacillus wuchangensis TaxID=2486001 RepID=UPI000F76B5E5|nr:sugar transferase [Lapidilactobacillus wuchangensis]